MSPYAGPSAGTEVAHLYRSGTLGAFWANVTTLVPETPNNNKKNSNTSSNSSSNNNNNNNDDNDNTNN